MLLINIMLSIQTYNIIYPLVKHNRDLRSLKDTRLITYTSSAVLSPLRFGEKEILV